MLAVRSIGWHTTQRTQKKVEIKSSMYKQNAPFHMSCFIHRVDDSLTHTYRDLFAVELLVP